MDFEGGNHGLFKVAILAFGHRGYVRRKHNIKIGFEGVNWIQLAKNEVKC
jgi:hypothetical protein